MSRRHFVALLSLVSALPSCDGSVDSRTAMDMTTVTELAADFSCYDDAPDSGAPEDAGPRGGSAVAFRFSSLFPREFIVAAVPLMPPVECAGRF